MVSLIKIEWTRLLKNKKNLMILGLLLALVLLLSFYNKKLNDGIVLRRNNMYELSVTYSMMERDAIAREYTDTLEGVDPETFDGIYPEENQKRQDYWTRDITFTNKQWVAFRRDGWLDEAKATLDKDRNMKEGLEQGLIRERNSQVRDIRTLQELDNRIRLNEYLVEHGIVPLKTEYEPMAYPYLFYLLGTVFPLALPLVVCLVCGDCFAAEVEEGSIKSWMLVPVRRWGIYYAKLAANFLFIFLSLAVVLGTGFLTAGLFHGFGAADYPVSVFYDVGHLNMAATVPEAAGVTVDYLPVAKAIWQMLLLDGLFTLFLTVLVVSLGSFIRQANTATTVLPLLFTAPAMLLLLAEPGKRSGLVSRIPLCYGYTYDILKAYGRDEVYLMAMAEAVIIALVFIVTKVAVKRKDWIC